jgi:CRISPR/Cas system CMR-associated protein Cmr3 (group 5 of RAMP superfamily)
MSPEEDKLINLAVHESSDPEMLRRDAEAKTGSSPKEESSDPEMLQRDAGSKTLDDFNYENEEDREQPPESDFDISHNDQLAQQQINIANRHAG